jgi:DNA gyrase/topoisomerase IV subunit A
LLQDEGLAPAAWRPDLARQGLVNMLPLEQGEQITSIMPLPEDEDSWANLDVMFATVRGTVRRNKLSDFVQINRNGKIAMKLEDGDGIVGVETCSEHSDVMLTTASGQCIRFPSPMCVFCRPEFRRRAWHPAGDERSGHFHADPASHRRGWRKSAPLI